MKAIEWIIIISLALSLVFVLGGGIFPSYYFNIVASGSVWIMIELYWAIVIPTIVLVWVLTGGPMRISWRIWMIREKDPIEVAKFRFANGDLDKVEFDEILSKLSAS